MSPIRISRNVLLRAERLFNNILRECVVNVVKSRAHNSVSNGVRHNDKRIIKESIAIRDDAFFSRETSLMTLLLAVALPEDV